MITQNYVLIPPNELNLESLRHVLLHYDQSHAPDLVVADHPNEKDKLVVAVSYVEPAFGDKRRFLRRFEREMGYYRVSWQKTNDLDAIALSVERIIAEDSD